MKNSYLVNLVGIDSPSIASTFEVDTLLLAVGLRQISNVFENIGIEFDENSKYLVVDESMQTSVEGIFVCGNNLHIHDIIDYVSKETETTCLKIF